MKIVKVAYLNSSIKLVKKLPLGNAFLDSISVLRPSSDHDSVKFDVLIDSLKLVFR